MRILFIRHGEPDYARDCLTETGRIQAEQAAERLCRENIEEIWSSPLGRAQETAEAAARVLGLPVRTLECMREVQWGSTDGTELFAGGHPWNIVDEMALKGLDLTRTDWRENSFFKTNRILGCIDQVEKGIDEWLAGFGYVRSGAYYTHNQTEEKHRTIAVFCHGGSSSAAIGHILNLPFPYICALLHLEYTGVAILRFDRRAGAGKLPCLEKVGL